MYRLNLAQSNQSDTHSGLGKVQGNQLDLSQTMTAFPGIFSQLDPKKAMVVASAGKIMPSVYLDTKGIVFIVYLQKGHTMNGEDYANLLRLLQKTIMSNRPRKLTKGVLFHQDGAPANKSLVSLASVRDCGFELVDHRLSIS